MLEFFQKLFVSNDFMPHGHCYLWRSDIVWLHVVADGLIVLAYFIIPFILLYFIRKRRDIPFHWLFIMFGAFIFACGTTHLLNIMTIWVPVYRFEGLVKLLTGVISLATVIMLIPIIPKVLDLPSVQATNEKLKKSTADLANSNKDLEHFAYVASHDLKEPLRMVTGFVQLLEAEYKGKLDPSADEYIRQAVSGAQRMHYMIEDLLEYSRVSSHGEEMKATDSGKVLKDALSNLSTAIKESGAVIEVGPLPVVKADPLQLIRLFQNLIGNGIKFKGPAVPAIQVAAEKRKDEWIFSVKDNGIGIDARYYQKIFEIFQRLHSREQYSGSGIGLAVCKRIVERHGGHIWVESTLGKGTTFYFSIPS